MATQQGGAEITENYCPTITEAAGTSGNNQPIVCIQQNTRNEVRFMNGDGKIAGALAAETGAKQQNYVCYENHAQDSRVKECGGCSPQINAKAGTGGGNLPLVRTIGYYPSQYQSPRECETTTLTAENCNHIRGDTPLVQAVAIAENVIGRQVENGGNGIGAQEELAYTQNTSGVMGVSQNATVRRLLPVECERLMGFPDNHTRIPWKGKPESECPDSPRYKACGNSMCLCYEFFYVVK